MIIMPSFKSIYHPPYSSTFTIWARLCAKDTLTHLLGSALSIKALLEGWMHLTFNTWSRWATLCLRAAWRLETSATYTLNLLLLHCNLSLQHLNSGNVQNYLTSLVKENASRENLWKIQSGSKEVSVWIPKNEYLRYRVCGVRSGVWSWMEMIRVFEYTLKPDLSLEKFKLP